MRRPLRTLLFVPADNDRRLKRAWTAPAGAVIADLEDGVSPARKERARQLLAEQVARGAPQGALFVRVSPVESAEFGPDLDLLRSLGRVDGIVVPKARAEPLRTTDFRLPVIALVESAGGLHEAPETAAVAGVSRLMLGTAELGIDIVPESPLFAHARAQIVRASDLVHRIFSPTVDELEWARSVVAAAGELEAGDGAINVGGQMVDLPVLTRAQRLLADSPNLDN